MTLVSVTAYHSFGGEVEASNTPTIRRLTPSCRHQLPRIAQVLAALLTAVCLAVIFPTCCLRATKRHSALTELRNFPVWNFIRSEKVPFSDRQKFPIRRKVKDYR